MFEEVKFPAGKLICKAGDKADYLYLIKNGIC
jgi:CRP-like cAMP-binding protein